MTATIKPPDRERRPRRRVPHFTSMESLGFSDSAHVWSDSPGSTANRTTATRTAPDPFTDWVPTDVGRLRGRNFRWSSFVVTLLVVGMVAGVGWWLYQQPAAQAEATATEISAAADDLEATLPAVESLNDELMVSDETTDMSPLDEADAAARVLFNRSGSLQDAVGRSAAAAASSAALDGVRLVRDAHAYRLAVAPMLAVPTLDTDPELIALDEAARAFGDWQLTFDQVRAALPEEVLSAITQEFELISNQLPSVLAGFVDALRADDQQAANKVLGELGERLSQVEQDLGGAIAEIQDRVANRMTEAREALAELSD